ncbi:oxo-5-alpha-steroid 4-dehydrogenase 1 [Seminavis robusta]|uniref:Oxo-5-alpha-steroid 4-dehydrogenase 1 n=1 Tax=Seminavis robusta TaxID=568900 RepID=A0A9N8DES5_9STRA|nr:oxo-5-alpha-steroid 4-dehydrogenase 1 [Seminavis robusta]|eukprot:Sro122_g059260.1 oxo-5-alpha-steroid 4-dehydrogenase 1 (282) ;mRNA; f:67717-68562
MVLFESIFASLEAEETFHHQLVMGVFYICPVIFFVLHYVIAAPWGKTFQTLLGPTIPAPIGWCLFEIPNLLWAGLCCYDAFSRDKLTTANCSLLALFVGHYINRALIYPLQLNAHSKPLPIEVVLIAHFFTQINGYIQSRAILQFQTYPDNYLQHPQFWTGVVLFLLGVAINWQSDHILRNLRKPPPTPTTSTATTATQQTKSHYVIPHGGFFRYVSAPHYMGEILEWTGFAIATQSLAAWSFVLFTLINLVPRGVAHHQWYLQNFKDYPLERKAVIPFVW